MSFDEDIQDQPIGKNKIFLWMMKPLIFIVI